MEYAATITAQQDFFATGRTRSYAFRRQALNQLGRMLRVHADEILAALDTDLGKPEFEAYGSEVALPLAEIRYAKRSLRRWMKGKRLPAPLLHWPCSARIEPEPLGCVLIISPWNYPVYLCLAPLIGAIAAGNCAVIKPSEISGATATLLAELIPRYFDPAHVSVATGGPEVAKELLAHNWQLVFFTGSNTVGRKVLTACAERLTPTILELGGKNPAIVDADADLSVAARRIVWGRFFNAGQTCLAPDFVCVADVVKDALIEAMKDAMHAFYSNENRSIAGISKIINEARFDKLQALLGTANNEDAQIVVGGEVDRARRTIMPTLVSCRSWQHPLMKEEIFGPILPVIGYTSLNGLVEQFNKMSTPLALYVFSQSRETQNWVKQNVRSGSVVINSVLSQLMSASTPFGGLGESGMRRYRGEATFEAFSHPRTVLRRSTRFDLSLSYPPYKIPLRFIRRIFHFFLR